MSSAELQISADVMLWCVTSPAYSAPTLVNLTLPRHTQSPVIHSPSFYSLSITCTLILYLPSLPYSFFFFCHNHYSKLNIRGAKSPTITQNSTTEWHAWQSHTKPTQFLTNYSSSPSLTASHPHTPSLSVQVQCEYRDIIWRDGTFLLNLKYMGCHSTDPPIILSILYIRYIHMHEHSADR